MSRYILKRILLMLPTILGVTIIIFTILELTPGNPAATILGPGASVEAIEQLNESLGVNRPFLVRLFSYIGGVFTGNFGTSYRTGVPVLHEVFQVLPKTVLLATLSCLISLVLGVSLGILSAVKQYSLLDVSGSLMAMIFAAVPSFWLAMILILVFALKLGWLPSYSADTFKHFILPALSLGIPSSAKTLRLTRTTMLETVRQDYIRTARAKGQVERKIIFNHALTNSLLPIITMLGMEFGLLLGGAIVVESVFSIYGCGTLIVNAIQGKDVPVVTGAVIILAAFFMIIMLFVDIVSGYVDPRVKSRYQSKRRPRKERA